MNKIYLKGSVEKKAKAGVYSIIASTSAIDRHGDSIDQAGWDLENFKSNPVLLWAHDYSELPIGKVTSIEIVKGNLVAEFEFAPADANPKAAQIQKLYEDGFVNASSVGLIPKERNGHVITVAELLELSLVPVPANQEALRLAVESKALDISLLSKDFEKGAVTDELNAEEAWQQKYENWSEFCDVISAFYSAYFDETVPVADFPKMLTETIGLLQSLATGDLTDTDKQTSIGKAMTPENLAKFMLAMTKEGRKLSKKTLEIIDSSVSSMRQSISALEDLKASAQSEGSDDESTETKSSVKKEEVIELPLSEFLKGFQNNLRTIDKLNENTLGVVNRFLEGKKSE